jgi:predicted nucleic acid-binding protein
MRTALDTNILSAVWGGEATGAEIVSLLGVLHRQGSLVVCGPVYAELRAHPMVERQFIDEYLKRRKIDVDLDLSHEVWDAAASAFADYANRRRQSGGDQPKRLLADFIVGAHALKRADRLLTLDAKRYQTAFPDLQMVVS